MNTLNAQPTRHISARVYVTGTVQGVGFRPFVYRLATELGLGGFVSNKGGIVEITLVGEETDVSNFLARLKPEAPPVAQIVSVEVEIAEIDEVDCDRQFNISASEQTFGNSFEIPPDIASCEDCLAELFDKQDRRYRYPFLNCTNCGPRFTVIRGLPYDRAETSMACFPMCSLCDKEYKDPADRRFHAQPDACAQCGPALMFHTPGEDSLQVIVFSNMENDRAIAKVLSCLLDGLIVAIKGLGGFHLACDATNDSAVRQLRTRKKREAKPFAVMMSDLAYVEKFCHVSDQEGRILSGQFRPIVLLKKRHTAVPQENFSNTSGHADQLPLSPGIAPGTHNLGVMLPYTPLQHLLLRDFGKPLVMTSANFSEEPIVAGNREAVARLSTIADAFLFHNRDISSRYDDTVTRVVNGSESVIRRARGYAPRSIDLPFKATRPVLALGGHMKNTFCLIKEDRAYVSQHIGDLDTLETMEHYKETLSNYLSLFRLQPNLLAIDMHPDYGSSRLAGEWTTARQPAPFDIKQISSVVQVQHHHAHIVSCMVENHLVDQVIGVAFDGIGYGADQKLWGGEFLLCNLDSFTRLARFRNVRMPGGAQSIKEPWRMALSYLKNCRSASSSSEIVEMLFDRLKQSHGEKKVSLVYSKLAVSPSSPETSSCGRLFDGVACLLDLCDTALYEGHAAVLLEAEAAKYCFDRDVEPYPLAIADAGNENPMLEIDTTSIIEGVIHDLETNRQRSFIAARFHETIARVILNVCTQIRHESGNNTVCLSGGVFQNERLLCRATSLLEADGFNVYRNSVVPANDGGLSLGQAAAALAQAGMLEF